MTILKWVVYILRCADDTLYTGITSDLDRRLTQHENGTGAKYTRGRGPCVLIHQETLQNRSAALKREAAIKAMSKAEKTRLAESNA